MKQRVAQINELVRSIVGQTILTELEMAPNTVVTVTKANTSPDLKNVTVFVSIIPDNKSLSTFDFLKRKIGVLQHFLGEKLSMRVTPRITLKIDYTEQQASHIEALLDNLKK